MKMIDPDMLPYAPRIDVAPFGCDPMVSTHIVSERLRYMGEHLGRDVPVLEAEALGYDLGGGDTIHASDLSVDPRINSVVLSRRRAFSTDDRKTGGLCVLSEDGLGNGSTIWVNMAPHGIKGDFDLGVVESKLSHELWHSVGLGHCAVGNCLMNPEITQEKLYDLSKLPSNGLCRDHRIAIDGIAHNPRYFTDLRRRG